MKAKFVKANILDNVTPVIINFIKNLTKAVNSTFYKTMQQAGWYGAGTCQFKKLQSNKIYIIVYF